MKASRTMHRVARSDRQAIEHTFHSGVPHISPHVLRRLPACVVRSERVVPIDLEGETLVVATQDPADFGLQERIRYISGRDLRVIAAPPASISRAIERFYPAIEEPEDDGFPVELGLSAHESFVD